MHWTDISKKQAVVSHLVISLGIFTVLLYFIVVHWYPQLYFATDGGWQGIRIIAGVDIIIGPLLTLVVYKPGKPGLKMDMAIIALLQVFALTTGVYFVYNERPVASIYADGAFHPVSGQVLQEAGLDSAILRHFGDSNPVLVFFAMPPEQDRALALRQTAMREARPVFLDSAYLQALNQQNLARIATEALDMPKYLQDKPAADQERYQQFLAERGGLQPQWLFVPVRSRYEWRIGVIDRATATLIATLDIRPPK